MWPNSVSIQVICCSCNQFSLWLNTDINWVEIFIWNFDRRVNTVPLRSISKFILNSSFSSLFHGRRWNVQFYKTLSIVIIWLTCRWSRWIWNSCLLVIISIKLGKEFCWYWRAIESFDFSMFSLFCLHMWYPSSYSTQQYSQEPHQPSNFIDTPNIMEIKFL